MHAYLFLKNVECMRVYEVSQLKPESSLDNSNYAQTMVFTAICKKRCLKTLALQKQRKCCLLKMFYAALK